MNEEYNLTSLIKMIIIIVLIMITFYGLTILITKKAKNSRINSSQLYIREK